MIEEMQDALAEIDRQKKQLITVAYHPDRADYVEPIVDETNVSREAFGYKPVAKLKNKHIPEGHVLVFRDQERNPFTTFNIA